MTRAAVKRFTRPRVWHPYAFWVAGVVVIVTVHAVPVAAGLYLTGLLLGPRTLHTGPAGGVS